MGDFQRTKLMPEIWLPTLHEGQAAAHKARTRFFALRCGRRRLG